MIILQFDLYPLAGFSQTYIYKSGGGRKRIRNILASLSLTLFKHSPRGVKEGKARCSREAYLLSGLWFPPLSSFKT